ncbi:hypothetical protein LTR66_005858 [Elasticomyces elasticus]|nr:hypothetical protein LTR66_005858 [Elasticomyces elasticus]
MSITEEQRMNEQSHRRNRRTHAPSSVSPAKTNGTNWEAPKAHRNAQPKQRGGSEAVLRTIPLSPAHPKSDNETRPRPVSIAARSVVATPQKAAYAGPTFHASPAPSALPMPRFLSRSVPANAPQPGLQARLDESDKDKSSPESALASPVPRAQGTDESPLDIFFIADRAEKAKRQSTNGLLSPLKSPMLATDVLPSSSPATPEGERHYPIQAPSSSDKSLFALELDGQYSDTPGQRRAETAAERAHISRAKSSPAGVPQADNVEAQRDAFARNLKDLLFNTSQSQKESEPTPWLDSQQPNPFTSIYGPRTSMHSPRSTSGPSTPNPVGNRASDEPLHYGNRNLSPLFRVAGKESPIRPSNLRQEFPPPPSGLIPASPSPISPSTPYITRQPPGKPDATAVSCDYLQAQVHAAQSISPAPSPFPSDQRGVPSSAPSPLPMGTAPQSRDIKSLEDDLRRMLKIGVLGSGSEPTDVT